MNKKLTLSMDESVIEAAKKYVENQGTSLSNLIENFLKHTTGVIPKKNPNKMEETKTPNVDKIREIQKSKLSPEESKRQLEEWYSRKPYMREVMKHLEEKHG